MNDSAFRVAYVVGLLLGSALRAVYTWPCKQNRRAGGHRTKLDLLLLTFASLGFVLPIIYVASRWLDFADYGLPAWAGWLGVGVFAAALGLLWRAHADLGRNWSPLLEIREGHTLVTEGVYRHIRHPMYAAHWLWGIAQALLLHNWLAGPSLLACFLPLYLVRVPREERMMLDRFGDEYRAYMNRTGRSVPRLRR